MSANVPRLGSLLHAPQELVRLRQAMREAAGVGAVAAPVGQFLPAHALVAAGGILPGQAGLGNRRSRRRTARRWCISAAARRGRAPSPAPGRAGRAPSCGWCRSPRRYRRITVAIAQASFGISTLSTCLPLRVLPTQSSSLTIKPCPRWLAIRNLRPPLLTNSDTIAASCSMSMNMRIGSPWPRPPGSLATSSE
jgi:hypothetical protein